MLFDTKVMTLNTGDKDHRNFKTFAILYLKFYCGGF